MKAKLYKVLQWFKDHFSFLVAVIVKLHIGKDKETSEPKLLEGDEDPQKGNE